MTSFQVLGARAVRLGRGQCAPPCSHPELCRGEGGLRPPGVRTTARQYRRAVPSPHLHMRRQGPGAMYAGQSESDHPAARHAARRHRITMRLEAELRDEHRSQWMALSRGQAGLRGAGATASELDRHIHSYLPVYNSEVGMCVVSIIYL